MDSEKELQFYLQAATDPKRDIQANLGAIAVLDKAYGLGLGIESNPEFEKQLRTEYSRLGGKKKAEKSTVKEGTTATNPSTGEKLIFRGGSWQPM